MNNDLQMDPNKPMVIVKVEDTVESRRGQFEIKVLQCIEKARILFALDDDIANKIDIRFTIKGKVGGRAGTKRGGYYLDFNPEAVEKYWDEMVEVAIPHEVAHIVAYAVPALRAKGHNKNWKWIDLKLGGNGDRTHSMGLTPARKMKKHVYVVAGERVELSTVRHNRIMLKGYRYRYTVGNHTHVIGIEHYEGEVDD